MMEAVVKGDSDIWTSSRNVRSGTHGPSTGAQDRLMLMRRVGRTEMQNCPKKGKIVKHLVNFHVSTCCRPAKVKGIFQCYHFLNAVTSRWLLHSLKPLPDFHLSESFFLCVSDSHTYYEL